MEFLSISQVQTIINEDPSCFVDEEEEKVLDDNEMPSLIVQEEEKEEVTTTDPLKYIDHMFMVCGFFRMIEKETITKNNVTRMYSSRTGLCVSLKCGIAYKCSFLYDNKIEYIYPSTCELIDYIKHNDNGNNNYYELISPSKIIPHTFEIIVFKQDYKPLSDFTLNAFKESFLNYTNISVSKSGATIIITYAPVCQNDEKQRLSVETFVKFLSPSY